MSIRPNSETKRHADRIAETVRPSYDGLVKNNPTDQRFATRNAVDAVLADSEVTNAFRDKGYIQFVTYQGIIARQVLETLKFDPNLIGVMAIGDVELPEFMTEAVQAIFQKTSENLEEYRSAIGTGYDLDGNGPLDAREKMIEYFNRFYGFSDSTIPDLREKFTRNSTITGGGMQAMQMVIGAISSGVREKNRTQTLYTKSRFNHADATFAMGLEIAKEALKDEKPEMNPCNTEQKNLLHLTPAEINAFYETRENERTQDIWYLIPAGNPSGTADYPENLLATCQRVLHHNPNAIILMDTTYVRTMSTERAKKQMHGILNDKAVLDRIVFVESFSKTHGFCGLRAGTYFCYNDDLYDQILSYDARISQGHGIDKAAFVKAVCDTTLEREAAFEKLRKFWGEERYGLYQYLIKSDKFNNLFHSDQSHLLSEQLEDTTTIYLTLRLKDETVTAADVVSETGAWGVISKDIASGRYIRFSVGVLTKETYAQYTPEDSAPDPAS